MKLPYICVRDTVVFPEMTQGLFIGREATIKAIDLSEKEFDGRIVLLTQKKFEQAKPKSIQDVFRTGTLCKIIGLVRLQDGTVKARFQGVNRFKVSNIDFNSDMPLTAGGVITESKENKKKLSDEQKRVFTELFVQAKPHLLFDEDATCLKDLKVVKNEGDLSRILQNHLRYTNPNIQKKFGMKPRKQEVKWINNRTHLLQQVLEAGNSNSRLKKLQEYLVEEIKGSIMDL